MKMISIFNSKGGVGKTTTCLNLAELIKPDLVIDNDVHNSFYTLNAMRSGEKFNTVKCDNVTTLKQTVASCDGKTVLVDCGGFDSDTTRFIAALSDVVLIPTTDNMTDLIALKTVSRILDQVSVKNGINIQGHVFLNRVNPNRSNFVEVFEYIKTLPRLSLIDSIVTQRSDVVKACDSGKGVNGVDSLKWGISGREYKALAYCVGGLL